MVVSGKERKGFDMHTNILNIKLGDSNFQGGEARGRLRPGRGKYASITRALVYKPHLIKA